MDKADLMDRIVQCRDSHTPEIYREQREALMYVAEGLCIRPGRVKHAVPFKDYWDTNWETIIPMWVLAFRKEMPLQVI